MAGNPDNLKPNTERTPEERKELAVKAGKASGKARRKFTANAGKNGEKFDKIMEQMDDSDIIRSVLLYEFES